jgi:hypothetical protein
MSGWDEELRTYLFKDGSVVDLEGKGEADSESQLDIGDLK